MVQESFQKFCDALVKAVELSRDRRVSNTGEGASARLSLGDDPLIPDLDTVEPCPPDLSLLEDPLRTALSSLGELVASRENLQRELTIMVRL